MRKLIMTYIRRKFGLKIGEPFRFIGQNSPVNYYYFTDQAIIKVVVHTRKNGYHFTTIQPSGVSLNYILSDECKIIRGKGAVDI